MGEGRLDQLRGCKEHVWGIDGDLAGGGRLAQPRGCTERAGGAYRELAWDGGLTQLRAAERVYNSTLEPLYHITSSPSILCIKAGGRLRPGPE